MDVLLELLDVEYVVVLEPPMLSSMFYLLVFADDVVLLFEPLDVEVVEVDLIQLLDGDVAVDPCA